MSCKCFCAALCLGLILTLCLPERIKLRIFLLSPGQSRYWVGNLIKGSESLDSVLVSQTCLCLFGSVFKGLKQTGNKLLCMVTSGCILTRGTDPILGVFYGGIMGGAEYLHLLIWEFEGRGNSPSLISTGMTFLAFLGIGLVPTSSHRKGKIVMNIIIY